MRSIFGLPEPYSVDEPGPHPARVHQGVHRGRGRRGPRRADPRPRTRVRGTTTCSSSRAPGTPGVGAVIGLSNAAVAAMLGAPAVIVTEGGVGRPIDEIVLNAVAFAAHGVPVAGAIVNKVESTRSRASRTRSSAGLAPHGIPLLGVLPYRPILSNPTLGMILEGVHGRDDLRRARTSTGSSTASRSARWSRDHMLERVGPGHAGHRPGRPRGRDPHAHDRAPRGDARSAAVEELSTRRRGASSAGHDGRGDRPGAHRRLPAAARGHRGDPAARTCSRRSSRTTPTPSRPRSTTCS